MEKGGCGSANCQNKQSQRTLKLCGGKGLGSQNGQIRMTSLMNGPHYLHRNTHGIAEVDHDKGECDQPLLLRKIWPPSHLQIVFFSSNFS